MIVVISDISAKMSSSMMDSILLINLSDLGAMTEQPSQSKRRAAITEASLSDQLEGKNGDNPHILTLSPPLDIDRKWFGMTLAYTTAKYGMSLVAHGLAEELGKHNVASNCLWPRTSLDTAAVRNVIGAELIKGSRKPSIYADAAYAVLKRDSSTCTGNFFLDQDVLEEEGVSDFDQYAIDPEATLVSDFFVDDNPEGWIQA